MFGLGLLRPRAHASWGLKLSLEWESLSREWQLCRILITSKEVQFLPNLVLQFPHVAKKIETDVFVSNLPMWAHSISYLFIQCTDPFWAAEKLRNKIVSGDHPSPHIRTQTSIILYQVGDSKDDTD